MHLTRRARGEHGAAAVEFALVALPLITLVFGMIQYGMFFWSMQGGADAARSAARSAAVGNPSDCATFRNNVVAGLGPVTSGSTAVTVTRAWYPSGAALTAANRIPDTTPVKIGDIVQVTVTFPGYDLNVPVPFLDVATITSRATARVDYVPQAPERPC